MKIIGIEETEFSKLAEMVQDIKSNLTKIIKPENPLGDTWYDIPDTIKLLKISTRTLMSYRSSGKLGYSKIEGKIYFKASDIKALLEKHYNKAF